MNEIIPGLWIGDLQDAAREVNAKKMTVFSVIEGPSFSNYQFVILGTGKVRVVSKDVLTHAAIILDGLLQKGPVLVHCGAGIERSPLMVTWYLLWKGLYPDLDSAFKFVQSKRPQAQDRTWWIDP